MAYKEESGITVNLNGTNWVTIKEFNSEAAIYEILIKVPTLANASNVILGLFSHNYQNDGDERWNSGNIPESDTTDVGLDRVVVSGNLLKIKADADPATEAVELTLYLGDSLRVR